MVLSFMSDAHAPLSITVDRCCPIAMTPSHVDERAATLECLDDETVDALLRGDERPSLERARTHLLECDACQDLVALATPRSDLVPGDVIAERYRIESEIGRGGMGIVYRAWDTKLERALAVKVLHSADPTAHARMNAEAQALARLSHPNIVTVFDVAVIDGRVCMVMELVSGTSLRAWLSGRPPVSAVVEALTKAGDGLWAAHRAGLVHRDFKPENVMIAADGQVKVCDFGLAKVDVVPDTVDDGRHLDGDMPIHRVTRTGTMVGTPAYMAPEQLAGKDASERSDQFAFAVCAWEVLFSAHPFAADTLGVLRRNFERGPRGASVAGLASLRRALERALARDPSRRHENMVPLLSALRGAATTGLSPARWAGVGVATVVVIGGITAGTAAALRAQEPAPTPPSREPRIAAPAAIEPPPTMSTASGVPLPFASATARTASPPPSAARPPSRPRPTTPRATTEKPTPRISTGPNGAPLIE